MEQKAATSRVISSAYLHYCANAGKRMTYKEMSVKLGVSERTFCEWLRGTNQPMVLKAFLKMLSSLSDEQVRSVLDEFR